MSFKQALILSFLKLKDARYSIVNSIISEEICHIISCATDLGKEYV